MSIVLTTTSLNSFPEVRKYAGHAYKYAHQKEDGWRIGLLTGNDGRTHAYTSGLSGISEIIPDEYRDWARPNTLLWVESYRPGEKARKPRRGEGKFLAIALPYFNGEDLRSTEMLEAFAILPPIINTGKVIVSREVFPEDLDEGAEGWVFKQSHYSGWFKFKPMQSADLKLVGFKPGKTGKYEGHVGAMILHDAHGNEVCTCSGFDEAIRFSLTEKDIGRIVEVSYQYVGNNGRLRHPQFVRWRDDKAEPGICE